MKITSAEAAKLLRQLNEEFNTIANKERNSKEFNAAVGEDIEELRPDYSYEETRDALDEIDAKIRKLKHAINVFNTVTKIPGFGMTIDQALVYIPQLGAKRSKLYGMMNVLPKRRCTSGSYSNIIDYTYANYDVEQAKADYAKAGEELARLQTALDLVNSTVTLEVEL